MRGSLTDQLRKATSDALNALGPDCQKFFNGLAGGLSALSSSVDELEFFDGRRPTGEGALLVSDIVSGSLSTLTLYQFAQGNAARVIANSNGIANGVVIGSIFNALGDLQGLTLVHEAAHYAYQLFDQDFASEVAALGYDPKAHGHDNVNGPSQLFNAFLQDGCPGSK